MWLRVSSYQLVRPPRRWARYRTMQPSVMARGMSGSNTGVCVEESGEGGGRGEGGGHGTGLASRFESHGLGTNHEGGSFYRKKYQKRLYSIVWRDALQENHTSGALCTFSAIDGAIESPADVPISNILARRGTHAREDALIVLNVFVRGTRVPPHRRSGRLP